MVRHVTAPDTEPEESSFALPSEDREHLFQVVDFETDKNDSDVIVAKCEVVGGDEEGRSLLHRANLDQNYKGFYYTRLFLKAIGEPYKGDFSIDENNWVGRQFYATVVHNKGKTGKTYANIDQFNFEKLVEQIDTKTDVAKPVDAEVAWDE